MSQYFFSLPAYFFFSIPRQMANRAFKEEYRELKIQIPLDVWAHIEKRSEYQRSFSSAIVDMLRERIASASPNEIAQLAADSNALLQLNDLAFRIAYSSDDSEVLACAKRIADGIMARTVRRPPQEDATTDVQPIASALAAEVKATLPGSPQPTLQGPQESLRPEFPSNGKKSRGRPGRDKDVAPQKQ